MQQTSLEAYQSVKPHVPALSKKVLNHIKSRGPTGATASETAKALALPRDSVSPRMKYLVEAKLIANTGTRRAGPSGRGQIVWRVV